MKGRKMQHFQQTGHYVSRVFTLLFLVVALALCAPFLAHAETNTQAQEQGASQVLTTQGGAGKTTNAVAAIIVGDEPTEQGGAQTIGIVLNDENATLAQGQLFATNIATNKVISTKAAKVQGNVAVFTFTSPASGTYYVSKLHYSLAGASASYEQSFAMDDANVFSVSTTGAHTVTSDDVTVSVFDLDENGAMVDSTALATTVQHASESALETGVPTTAAPPVSNTQSASGPVSTWAPATGANPLAYKFVIAIDPGHGGSDAGAAANGLQEKDINLKIAKACAEELKQYQNIEVFMTRTTDVYVGLEARVATAKNNGARVFVSIHINAAEATSAKGTEVYYPIGSAYLKNQTHGMGKVLAQDILDELLGLGLGLTSRGIVTRETTVNDTYADGSKSDYYSVIRNSRARGIPGLIVEHAFITNAAEAKIMKSDANLTKMGKADAAGIAKAYNFATGYWYKDNGTWKYWDGKKYLKNTWLYRAGTWYYFNGSEQPVSGVQKINGAWYYFDKTTFENKSGWVKDGGKWYYGRSDGAVKEIWSLKPGWLKISGTWYYFDPNTNGYPAKTGLFTVDGVKYYCDSNCKLVTNKDVTVGGKTYHAAASGALTEKGAAAASAGKTDTANLAGKWEKWPSGWYFKKSNGEYATGLFSPTGDSRWYYCNANGLMKTGWVKVSGKWYYANSNGAMASGWKKLGGAWYYLDPNTKAHPALTGFFSDGKARYYTHPTSCAMQTGWIKVNNTWYYAKGSGALVSGWIKLKGYWYYLDPAKTNYPAKADELFTVGGVKYYVDSSCALAVNKDVTVGGTKYHAAASGALTAVAATKTVSTVKSATATEDYDIMGKPGTTVAKMVAAYKKTGNTYPASTYKAKGAASIEEFCQILYDEAVAEGVRPEVVFAQSMLETAWLRFGGMVKAEQCNFAGIGATTAGTPATFKDVQEGLRAQVQHLKAYASTESLKNKCVDPRFNLVKRGCATTVINLGQKENPEGYGWATSEGYGSSILAIMKANNLI